MCKFSKWNIIWRSLLLSSALTFVIYMMVNGFFDIWKIATQGNLNQATGQKIILLTLNGIAVLLILHFFPQLLNFIIGNYAEKIILKKINFLGSNYKTFRCFKVNPQDKFDTDIIVVSHKGISIIEVKSHSGKIFYSNGKLCRAIFPLNKDFVWQINRQTKNLKDYLRQKTGYSYPIQKIIVFAADNAYLDSIPNPLPDKNIYVIKKNEVNGMLKIENRPHLNQREINKICFHLKSKSAIS